MGISRFLMVFSLCLAAVSTAAPLTFCYEDKEDYPWRIANGEGLDIALMKQVSQALHMPFTLQSLPWLRCTQLLQAGTVDGVIGASFLPERQSWGRYPLRADGTPDASKQLHTASYSLYYRKNSAVTWDGKVLNVEQGLVGMQTGFSIGKLLQKLHVSIYADSNNPLNILRMLSLHRLAAAALQTSRADELLEKNPALSAVIVRSPIPLEEKPYYLMLSNKLVAQQPELARLIWDSIAKQRDTHAYHTLRQQLLNQTSQ